MKGMRMMARLALTAGVCAALSSCAADIAHSPPGAAPVPDYVYKLAPDDHVRVTVYGEANLTGEYIVNSQGDVSFPLGGAIHAEGLTVNDFTGAVRQALSAHFFKNPQVATDLVASRPIYVLGEVNKAGQFPYQSNMTVLGAVATAGGFTYRANQKVAMVRHKGQLDETRERLTADLIVQPGDTIRIKERNF
jgi:protein involved in polysaccharide export with SLBB domain